MLTDLQIKRLKPGPKRRIVSVGDGLSIRVEPSGRKNWIARKAGRTRGLGSYPEVSLAEARAAVGIAVDVPTQFGQVWDQWFAEQVVGVHRRPQNATNLRPLWASIEGRRVDTLTRSELVALLRRLKARAPTRAIRATTQLRHVLLYAQALGLIDVSPLYAVPMSVTAGRSQKRTRVLTDPEIAMLQAHEAPHAAFCRFLLATGCRRGEALAARRSWVDGDGWLNFPEAVMKAKRPWEVWLSPFAWDQVAPSNRDEFFDWKEATIEAWVRRQGWGFTCHDLRRTMASRMGAMGIPPHVISGCLAHAHGTQADQHYLHGSLYATERRDALNQWGQLLCD